MNDANFFFFFNYFFLLRVQISKKKVNQINLKMILECLAFYQKFWPFVKFLAVVSVTDYVSNNLTFWIFDLRLFCSSPAGTFQLNKYLMFSSQQQRKICFLFPDQRLNWGHLWSWVLNALRMGRVWKGPSFQLFLYNF